MARRNMQSHELGSNGLMNCNGPPQYSPQPNPTNSRVRSSATDVAPTPLFFNLELEGIKGVKQRTRLQSRYEGSVMEIGQESKSQNEALIKSFVEITSSSSEEARFFLESHKWDLDAAVSTFLDSGFNPVIPADSNTVRQSIQAPRTSRSPSNSPDFSPSRSPSRSRSPSPPSSRDPYELRSRRGLTGGAKSVDHKASGSRGHGIRTLADLNRAAQEGSGSDSDEPQEYYTGGEKSGMLVQDPSKHHDVDAIFNQARQSQAGVERPARASSSSKSFKGTGRLLSGETLPPTPQPPEVVVHTITFWRNGFSIDDGPLRRLDDPENAPFLESIRRSERPKELEPADRRTSVEVHLVRRDENYPEPVKHHVPFQGVGRTLGGETSGPATPFITSPLPSLGLIVDDSLPTTSIQLRLADGTRMVSRFNNHHTIGDVRSFIDASRPGGARSYHLQSMGFPPKKLTELDQTIEEAGIANSVVIQKF